MGWECYVTEVCFLRNAFFFLPMLFSILHSRILYHYNNASSCESSSLVKDLGARPLQMNLLNFDTTSFFLMNCQIISMEARGWHKQIAEEQQVTGVGCKAEVNTGTCHRYCLVPLLLTNATNPIIWPSTGLAFCRCNWQQQLFEIYRMSFS